MLLTHYLNGKTTFLLFSFQFVLIVTRGVAAARSCLTGLVSPPQDGYDS
jgi:hypothetical protein